MLDTDVVYVGVKALVYGLVEYLAEICTVVAEKRCNGLKLDIVLVVMVYVVDNIVEDTVT